MTRQLSLALTLQITLALSLLFSSRESSAQVRSKQVPMLRATVESRLTDPTDRWQPVNIRDVEVDRFGNTYVFDVRQQSIAKFDKDDRFQGFIGKRGAGPGEFEHGVLLQLLNDTLWVLEGHERTSYFSVLNPRVGNSKVVTSGASPKALERVLAGGLLKLSMVELSVGGMLEVFATDRLGRASVPIVKAMVQARSFYYTLRPSSQGADVARTQMVQPFWIAPLWSVSRDGQSVITATYRETSGAFDTIVVTSTLPSGIQQWRRQFGYAVSPLNDRQFQSIVDSLSKPRPSFGKKVMMIADKDFIRQSLYRPKHWPPLTRIITGVDSTTWLRVHSPDASSQKWWILSNQGVLEAEVVLPPGVDLLRGSRTTVWARSLDKDDVPVVLRLRLSQ